MAKEVETAGEVANSVSSGGFQSFIGAVYGVIENIFGWLSSHQGIALLIILIVLGIMVWLLMRAKKYRRNLADEVYLKKKEIGKKDTRIEELESQLAGLQKKLSDQQAVVREALLETIRTLTGYDGDQLPVFFQSLRRISGNPLDMADPRENSIPETRQLEEKSDDSSGVDDAKQEIAAIDDSSEVNNAAQGVAADDDSSEEDEPQLKIAADDDSSERNDAPHKRTGLEEGSAQTAETKKPGEGESE